jgi:hypothetical protein
MGTAQLAPCAGRHEVLVAWLKIGNRMLEAVEDSRPKFHAIQICAQSLKRFDQISHNGIGRLFRHFFSGLDVSYGG